MTQDYLDIAQKCWGAAVPTDPMLQLEAAARAICRSWESPKAQEYRRLNAFNDLLGTAVTVQAMVFGNAGGDSGSGVAFTAGFAVAAGILTAVGGRTAHAAVVARQLGKVCVVGCGDFVTDGQRRLAKLGDKQIGEGDWLSLDGETGEVFLGKREIAVDRPTAEINEVTSWLRRN